jgi:hypothetical protein
MGCFITCQLYCTLFAYLFCMQYAQLTRVSGLNSTPNPFSNNPVCHQEGLQILCSIPETSNDS